MVVGYQNSTKNIPTLTKSQATKYMGQEEQLMPSLWCHRLVGPKREKCSKKIVEEDKNRIEPVIPVR